MHETQIAFWQERFARAIATGQSQEFDFQATADRGGGWYTVCVSLLPTDGPGHPRLSFASVEITQRKQAEKELNRLNRALRAMTECNQVMMRANDTAQLLNDICRVIVEAGGYRTAWVGQAMDDPGKPVRPVASGGNDEDFLQRLQISWDADNPRGHGPTGQAIRSGQAYICDDVATDPNLGPWRVEALKRRYASSVSLPLTLSGKVWGALNIYNSEPQVLDQAEIALLTQLADDLVYGMQMLEARRQHRQASEALAISEQRYRAHAEELEREVAQRRAAEEAGRESDARLRLAMEAARLIVWEWDPVTDLVKWDASAAGRPDGQAAPAGRLQDYVGRIDPADRLILEQAISRVRQAGVPLDVEFRGEPVDGQQRWLWALGRVMRDGNGQVHRMIGIAQDITPRKRTEEQLLQSLKMEAIGRLAGGIAHDFNNVLAVIGGYSESLLRQLEPDSLPYRNAQEIDKAASRAAGLTRQLLAFSRRQVIRPNSLDINAVIQDLQPMLRQSLPDKVELRLHLSQPLDAIKADRGQIEQVVMNLVLNARDAMKKGGQLILSTANIVLDAAGAGHRSLPAGPYVGLRIEDTGCGMSPEVLQHIFEPFFSTKDMQGTGLGLSIVYGIVKEAGGGVFVQSRVEAGSTFEVLFPSVVRGGE